VSTPLEHYAMIGDLETAALVDRDGSIDWLCWPRFDSDACFAALLGYPEHGCWSITPDAPVTRRERRYQTDTLIMETDLHTADGGVRIIDFMPIRDGPSSLIRIVQGLHGRVHMRMDLALRFSYGEVRPWTERHDDGFIARIGPDQVVLHMPVAMDWADDRARSAFDVEAGQRLAFVLRYSTSDQPPPPPLDPEALLTATQRFWREWIGKFDDSRTKWPAAVRRSLLTLKAMVWRPSGGLIAAPTTSLPEAPGGSMNWDYRFCWLRDASFTISALANAGYTDEARRWRDWLLRAVGGRPESLHIMYRLDGGRRLAEYTVDLPGWRHARPVRIGNAAAEQRQLDVYGELLHALNVAREAGIESTDHEKHVARQIALYLEQIWTSPGAGVWESRGEPRHYVYSKAMAWAGLEAFRQAAAAQLDEAGRKRLESLARVIHGQVLQEGWNEGLGYLTQYYGGHELDASLLRLPMLGFLPATEPRMAATIAAIKERLNEGGLIRRKAPLADGPNEGAFLACSCWMADCLALQGKLDEAAAQFERVLAVSNDVGLLSEEYDVPGQHLCGNFPQALTHLAVVDTALSLSKPNRGTVV
jgi:GH15 family glucan-1,4-alpha-glucosidase